MPKLFLVINNDKFFLSHRTQIALAAKEKGYEVTVVASSTGREKEILDMGLNFIPMPMNTTGMNLFEEVKTLLFLIRLYREQKPDIIHQVGLKPVLWGTCAARLNHNKHVINAISGTGFLFSPENKTDLASIAVRSLLRTASKTSYKYIFQNHDDEKEFCNSHIVNLNQSVFIKGSGVDLNKAYYVPEEKKNNQRIRIVFTGRMIKAKGVYDLIEAANLLKTKYQDKIQFILCGAIDANPTAIKESELKSMCDGDYIKWIGFQSDIFSVLDNCHIFAFPSYYMEGLPKSIIDAEAVGLPVITTDWVGCRDTVVDGENGYLIPVKDPKALAEKIEILVNDNDLRQQMGKSARLYAEKNFSIENVVDKHLGIYEKMYAIAR